MDYNVGSYSPINFEIHNPSGIIVKFIIWTDGLLLSFLLENGACLVDFYAPWCPPCMRLLPELRKASRQFDSTINFGTIDCTIHAAFCRQHNIRSYPTTILYNNTQQQQFLGEHTVTSVVDFLQDFLNPTGIFFKNVTYF